MGMEIKKLQVIRETGTRIAPAVALLLLADTANAIDPDSEDNIISASEPSTLGLLAAGAVVGCFVTYIRNKRRK